MSLETDKQPYNIPEFMRYKGGAVEPGTETFGTTQPIWEVPPNQRGDDYLANMRKREFEHRGE